ncbi:13734_t:CDS:1 [Funneliformis geosporum]|uniref:4460_t:CDS:1 n=1 Tax=Funneliformis geosporum TaxID=1117311 RepID=A0A9W4SFR8_9GLOM|nr:13734_t:CDS:1 [Funneliformis geosporum]CAI2166786.1 4460_t:CDS:1 [Funneliformis geosporum]
MLSINDLNTLVNNPADDNSNVNDTNTQECNNPNTIPGNNSPPGIIPIILPGNTSPGNIPLFGNFQNMLPLSGISLLYNNSNSQLNTNTLSGNNSNTHPINNNPHTQPGNNSIPPTSNNQNAQSGHISNAIPRTRRIDNEIMINIITRLSPQSTGNPSLDEFYNGLEF